MFTPDGRVFHGNFFALRNKWQRNRWSVSCHSSCLKTDFGQSKENLCTFDREGWKFYLDFAYGKLWLLSVCFHVSLLLSFLLTKPTSVGSPLYLQISFVVKEITKLCWKRFNSTNTFCRTIISAAFTVRFFFNFYNAAFMTVISQFV